MVPTTVRFLSDEGDASGIDLDILDKERERIQRVLKQRGDLDSMTYGSSYMDMIDIPNGDYIFVGWYAPSDEEAVVFSVAPSAVEEPPEF